MGVNFKLIFILTGLIFILSSCRTSAPRIVEAVIQNAVPTVRDSPTRYTGKYTVLRFREIPKT